MAAKQQVSTIIVPKDVRGRMRIRVVGDSPLVCSNFSEKAKQQMREKQQKMAKGKREAKNPQADFEGSLYPHPDGGYGFPAVAFKSAAVGACRLVEGVTMKMARMVIHVLGDDGRNELVKLEGEPIMREDVVRLAGPGRTADLRYRASFEEWATEFDVEFLTTMITPEQVVHLFNLAGSYVGVGEWRLENNGPWGKFHVQMDGE